MKISTLAQIIGYHDVCSRYFCRLRQKLVISARRRSETKVEEGWIDSMKGFYKCSLLLQCVLLLLFLNAAVVDAFAGWQLTSRRVFLHTRSFRNEKPKRISSLQCRATPLSSPSAEAAAAEGEFTLDMLREAAGRAMIKCTDDELKQWLPRIQELKRCALEFSKREHLSQLAFTEGVHAIPLHALPADIAVPYENVKKIIANFPDQQNGFLKIPSLDNSHSQPR